MGSSIWTKLIIPSPLVLLIVLAFAHAQQSLAQSSYDFRLTGRLVESSGKPLDGPVALRVNFYRQATGGTSILSVTKGLESITLKDGIFHISLSLSAFDYHAVFPGLGTSTYFEVTDLTHAANKPYERSLVSIVPYAAKIPVDGNVLRYNEEGKLTFSSTPAAGNYLKANSDGTLSWDTPAPGTTLPASPSFSTGTISSTSTATSGSIAMFQITPTYNQLSGSAANTDLLISRTETVVGSGTQRLIDAQVGGTTKFNVSNTGTGYFAGNVGIGTSTPTNSLTIEAAVSPAVELRRTGQSHWKLQHTNNGFAIQNSWAGNTYGNVINLGDGLGTLARA